MMENKTLPEEGDLYKTCIVDHHVFEIRYGYHEESERGRVDPLPIFPDLEKNPLYTNTGELITAYVQYPCRYYIPRRPEIPEDWCGDCMLYGGGKEEMGRCLSPERKRE